MWTALFLSLELMLAWTHAQQIFIPVNGTSARTACTPSAYPTPTYAFTPFSFSQSDTVRTATSVPPATTTTTYAPPYVSLSHLVPNLSTTTWGNWVLNATATANDTNNPYGQAAWTSLWKNAPLPNYTFTGLYSTTVAPTPVPTSELILPPADYFGPTDCYHFPDDFMFGVAGSAAQIEGAIAVEGKTPTILDVSVQQITETRQPDYVANENYFLYKQDIERLASIGVKYYSFSIPWTRVLPFVLPGTPVNQAALDHYDDLVNFVLEKGMIPVMTLLHFDTPLVFFADNYTARFNDAQIGYVDGGYQNETFQDAFVHYGKVVMTHFADRIPVWFTFNEPLLYANNGKSIDTVIKAHARLAHFYRDEIKGTGKISLKFNDNFGVPLDPSNQTHVDAASHFNQFQLGTFCNPIFLGEDYPEAFKITIPDYVPLNATDLEYINGTADFIGIDPYTATVVSPPPNGISACAANRSDPRYPYCVTQSNVNKYGWNIGYRSISYVYITPTYLRSYLSYLYNTWRSPVLITEFGFPVYDEADKGLPDQLFDTPRSIYYLSYMSEILKSIWEDHVQVLGAFAWSFADNWEFGDYASHFGIQTVDRSTQERRYKKSFFDLVDFMNTRMPREES